jgi:site-specific DNA-cytosine methylase
MNDDNCASYFDQDSRSRQEFSNRNPAAHVASDIEAILQDPTKFVEATKSVDYIHVTPPCTSYTRGGSKFGLRVDSGRQMLRFFDLLRLLPNVPMVRVENVANFWKFADARKGFICRARKLGFRVHSRVMTSSDFGSTQGVRKRVYIALIKEDFADARPRWSHPARTGQEPLSTVSALLSATKELSEKLASQETVTLASMHHEPWYRGPMQVGILGNAPYPNDPTHSANRGYKVYDTQGKGAVITSTSDMSPGGATQLYLDECFEKPIVR